MPHPESFDSTDARIVLAMLRYPRATALAIADAVGISRNTAQARLRRLQESGTLAALGGGVSLEAMGYHLSAYVTARVKQSRLTEVAAALTLIDEVLSVDGVAGDADLVIRVAGHDAAHLYRVAGRILAIDGVKRTSTQLVMRPLLPYRIEPLLQAIAAEA